MPAASGSDAELVVDPRSVLVVQTWGIGDVVMTSPMLHAIRETWPGADITLAVRSKAAGEVVDGLVNRVCHIPAFRTFAFLKWAVGLRRHRFDLAIVATRQHPIWAMVLRYLAGVAAIAADSSGRSLRAVRYHRSVALESPEHRVDSNLALLEQIVGPLARSAPLVPVTAVDNDAAAKLVERLDLPADALLIGVHPGSDPKVPQKRYPRQQMLALLLDLLERTPRLHALVFFGGEPNDDRAAFGGAHDRLHVVADVGLRVVTALTRHCAAFLAGDTGLAHIAAAQKIPVVVIAGPTQVQSTRPWGANVRVVTTDSALACMPCYGTSLYGTCTHVSCMTTLPIQRVAERVLETLNAENRSIDSAHVTNSFQPNARGVA
jgi:heptosyltransferase-2